MLYAIPLIVLLGFGGYYTWVKCLAGCLISLSLLDTALNGKKKIAFGMHTPAVVLCIIAITTIWSVDRSRNVEGILTGIVLLGWYMLVNLLEDKKKNELLSVLPYAGVIVVVISVVALTGVVNVKLWASERLGGIFQYSNTCALFLMLGVIVESWQINRKKYIHFILLIVNTAGIFLTGSRSIVLALIIWLLYKGFTQKKDRKIYFIFSVIAVTVIAVLGFLHLGLENIARVATVFESSSSVWARILFWKDALILIVKHPLGMGYMGYSYAQEAVKTGVYTTMFVHNELLQICLDYGIIAMVLILAYIVRQIVCGRQSRLAKELLVVIVISSLVDFHMQYFIILMVLCLCLDGDVDLSFYNKISLLRKKQSKNASASTGIILGLFVLILLFAYETVAYGSIYRGNYNLAHRLLPHNTEAMEMIAMNTSDMSEAKEMADRIIKINKYSKDAYQVLEYAAAVEGNAEELIHYGSKVAELSRYDIEQYRQYDQLLGNMIDAISADASRTEELTFLYNEREELKVRLDKLREHTSPLAYKLTEQPVFVY